MLGLWSKLGPSEECTRPYVKATDWIIGFATRNLNGYLLSLLNLIFIVWRNIDGVG